MQLSAHRLLISHGLVLGLLANYLLLRLAKRDRITRFGSKLIVQLRLNKFARFDLVRQYL
ncbi:hypothetical protein T01_16036 [Trichinella spiralis]|uniref:Uncharacterized protein n=1 Tax=Trichinella spiralis TaxID=6334 RepID=A0A0V1BEM0_TRISP|nr:hypothetical protein T01_16036 [Trichinella spiralis]